MRACTTQMLRLCKNHSFYCVDCISCALRTGPKSIENRAWNALRWHVHAECRRKSKICDMGPLWARFWRGLGASGASLGPILGDLERHLGALGPPLSASWTSLGRSWAPLGCLWAVMGASRLDFGRFGGGLGWVWQGFWAGFATHFAYNRWIYITHELLQETQLGICLGFSFPPAARRYVRSTWNWSQVANFWSFWAAKKEIKI